MGIEVELKYIIFFSRCDVIEPITLEYALYEILIGQIYSI